EGFVQRLLCEFEAAEQTDERGEDAARFSAVDRVDRECISSWTGRISITPTRAGGNLAATAQASSMSLASMTKNPPSCSFVSAKGPAVVETLPARTRMVRAVRTRCRASEAM